MSDEENMVLMTTGVVLMLGVIGSMIGSLRGRAGFGFVIGILLGPIGWLLVLLMPGRPKSTPPE